MKLSLGFSPCPNDTFIFDALVNKKIDTEGLDFTVAIEDVETLNEWATAGKLDITKLSFAAYFEVNSEYALLNSGSALGRGVGPLLVSRAPMEAVPELIENSKIVLPGLKTTANLLFSFAYPGALNKHFMIFSKIEEAVLKGEADLGVIIHESRFTYREKGLHKVLDLGEYWEKKMKVPVPLGGVVIQKKFGAPLAGQVGRLVRESIRYSFARYPQLSDYVAGHSQEMSEEVMRKHIDLYVNDYSLDLGSEGLTAIETLHSVHKSTAQLVKE